MLLLYLLSLLYKSSNLRNELQDPGPTDNSFCYGAFLKASTIINLVFLNFEVGYFPTPLIEIASYSPGPGVIFRKLIWTSSGRRYLNVKLLTFNEELD